MRDSRRALDFTEGSILPKMAVFAWPMFVGNLLQAAYQVVDSLWVGNLLGEEALSAVTISTPLIFAVLSFMIGVNSATLTLLSQQRGRGDTEGVKHSLNAFVVILGSLAIFLGIVGVVAAPWLLQLMDTPESIMEVTTAYLQINFTGIIFLFGYNFIGTVLRAMGDSRTPVRFVWFALLLNTVLDPLLIWGVGLGVQGAAIATVVSQGCAFLYGLWYSIRRAGVPFDVPYRPEARYVKAVLKLGLPGGLQMMAISSGMVAILSVVNGFGKEVIAGFGASQRLESLIMLPAMTLGAVVNSMAGQNIGAGKWDRVGSIARHGALLIVGVSVLIGALVYALAEPLIRLFVQDAGTVSFGVNYLRIVAFFYPFIGINFVLNGVARSSGAMLQVLVLNLISFWVLRYPLVYVVSRWLGEEGIAWGTGISFAVSSAIATGYYYLGSWRKAKALED